MSSSPVLGVLLSSTVPRLMWGFETDSENLCPRLIGGKPFAVRLCGKMTRGMRSLEYFTTHQVGKSYQSIKKLDISTNTKFDYQFSVELEQWKYGSPQQQLRSKRQVIIMRRLNQILISFLARETFYIVMTRLNQIFINFLARETFYFRCEGLDWDLFIKDYVTVTSLNYHRF